MASPLFEYVLRRSTRDTQFAAETSISSTLHVRADGPCRGDRMECRDVRPAPRLGHRKRQALEMKRGIALTGFLRKPQPIGATQHGEHAVFAVIREEVVKVDAEHHRDSQERGQRRKHLVALQLGQERRGEARMPAELDEAELLLEPQGPELLPTLYRRSSSFNVGCAM